MARWTIVFLCLLSDYVSFCGAASGTSWKYGEETKWGDGFPECNKNSQSPINIRRDTTTFDKKLAEQKLTAFDADREILVTNTGYSISANFKNESLMKIELPADFSAGENEVPAKLIANSFHFHWGADSSKGSEHTVDGAAYPLEVHFVCYNEKYGDLGTAVSKNPDGLAVFGFFFEETAADNPNLAALMTAVTNLSVAYNNQTLGSINVGTFLPKDRKFYRYKGSLTTPPCYESVTWTVFNSTIPIGTNQLNIFRSYTMRYNATYNFRPVQPMNGRAVYTNEAPPTTPVPDSADHVTAPLALLIAFTSVLRAL